MTDRPTTEQGTTGQSAAGQGTTHRLDERELRQLADDGYVVRTGVFSSDEVAAATAACEALVAKLVAQRRGERTRVGSYVFEPDASADVVIKWEGDTDVVHGLEPFAHLSDELWALAHDPRFLDPMKDLVGHDEPMLFTEKLNLKRPRHGGPNPLHQDHPYWVGVAEQPDDVATAIVFLDDSNLANGCLHVVPGSHRRGRWPTRTDGDAFARHETDPALAGDVELVPVEVPAGSLVLFGSLLVHQSTPNTSDLHRRALLYSYQPPGLRRMVDVLRAGGADRER